MHIFNRQFVTVDFQLRELQDLAQTNSDASAEWQAKYEDLDYKLAEAMKQVTRLDHRLYEAQEKNKKMEVELSALKCSDSPGIYLIWFSYFFITNYSSPLFIHDCYSNY